MLKGRIQQSMMGLKYSAATLPWWGIIMTLFLAAAALTDPKDAAALRALRKNFQDPHGVLNSWKGGDPCNAGWRGIICDPASDLVTEIHIMNSSISGTIAPEVGDLVHLQILNLMWNQITGSIPASLGNLEDLNLLLLNGNNLTGTIPAELGKLVNMNRLQIDENQISGPIPSTFGNLIAMKHLHMNNNSLNGSIPSELGKLSRLVHILVDNNWLSGELPTELANVSTMQIIQLDNNNFGGATIPPSYGKLENLLKLSMRNCSLKGTIPDISGLPKLEYLDLSGNHLTGEIPRSLPVNITTIDMANNQLSGTIPLSFGQQDKLQVILLGNNQLNGTIPIELVKRNISSQNLFLDFQNNSFSGFSSDFDGKVDANTTLRLYGNTKLCGNSSTFCTPGNLDVQNVDQLKDVVPACQLVQCVHGQNELVPNIETCICASPIQVLIRLKSPGFTFFAPYLRFFSEFMASELNLTASQAHVAVYTWEPGPRLFMNLKLFPSFANGKNEPMNSTEVLHIYELFSRWHIRDNPLFGPRELKAFIPPYGIEIFNNNTEEKKELSKAALAGVLIGAILGTAIIVGLVAFKLTRKHKRYGSPSSKSLLGKVGSSIKIDNVKAFSFEELSRATDSFSDAQQIGKGGYGKVYKGVLEDKQVVAIKRADSESHQGETEFFTEIQLLSRIHHRNLVSLIGFCVDNGEQMLVYEFIGGGTLTARLSEKPPLDFKRRVYIALGASRGIMYLHTEANPPIIHRDIKGTNILIGEKDNAKVADFGLSKLAPEEDIDGVFGHVSTVVKGTPGYLDPEYFLTRKLSDKSDIYSFGVVLLEIVTGLQAISRGKNLVREVRSAYGDGSVLSIVDPFIGPYPPEALEAFAKLALSCCLDTPEGRPHIRTVARDLEDIWKSMGNWSQTTFDDDSSWTGSKSSNTFFHATSSSSNKMDEFSRSSIGAVVPR